MHPLLIGSSSPEVTNATPLDYGDDLIFFLDAENGVTESAGAVSLWTGQGPDAIEFEKPGSDTNPFFLSSEVNGLPAIDFSETAPGTGLDRRLRSADSLLDNIFSGPGNKSIAFAARVDAFEDTNFGVNSFIMDKATTARGATRQGWRIRFKDDGSLTFRHYRANGSFWELTADGFYSAGDLVLGTLVYDGGNTSSSGAFTLFNGSSFVTTGTVATGSSSTIGDDSDGNLNVGNQEGPTNGFNSPFQGVIMALWATSSGSTSLDQGYLSRWVA